jgi:hypothetical protein
MDKLRDSVKKFEENINIFKDDYRLKYVDHIIQTIKHASLDHISQYGQISASNVIIGDPYFELEELNNFIDEQVNFYLEPYGVKATCVTTGDSVLITTGVYFSVIKKAKVKNTKNLAMNGHNMASKLVKEDNVVIMRHDMGSSSSLCEKEDLTP